MGASLQDLAPYSAYDLTLGNGYYQQMKAIVEEQLKKAGARLARTLNELFGDRYGKRKAETVTVNELVGTTDALAKLLIEKALSCEKTSCRTFPRNEALTRSC